MRIGFLALATLFVSNLSAQAAPVPYDAAAQNLKSMLVAAFRVDASQMRDTDSLSRDWLMDLSVREVVEHYQHRFNGPEAKRVMQLMKLSCNNDSIRCIAQGIAGASK